MSTRSIYRLSDGVFTGARVSGAERVILANTPAGCGAIDGAWDAAAWRVDLATGQPVPYTPPPPPDEVLAQAARAWRDQQLAACDWVSLRAADTGQPVPAAWQAYRQALRDITHQPGWPRDIVRPVAPDTQG